MYRMCVKLQKDEEMQTTAQYFKEMGFTPMCCTHSDVIVLPLFLVVVLVVITF